MMRLEKEGGKWVQIDKSLYNRLRSVGFILKDIVRH